MCPRGGRPDPAALVLSTFRRLIGETFQAEETSLARLVVFASPRSLKPALELADRFPPRPGSRFERRHGPAEGCRRVRARPRVVTPRTVVSARKVSSRRRLGAILGTYRPGGRILVTVSSRAPASAAQVTDPRPTFGRDARRDPPPILLRVPRLARRGDALLRGARRNARPDRAPPPPPPPPGRPRPPPPPRRHRSSDPRRRFKTTSAPRARRSGARSIPPAS